MASELFSVHIVLKTWIISVKNLKKVGVRLVAANVDVIFWKGVFLANIYSQLMFFY